MGGNIPGGNFLGENFPGEGEFPGGNLMGGNFPGGCALRLVETFWLVETFVLERLNFN